MCLPAAMTTTAQKRPNSASLSAKLLSRSANSNMESIKKRALDELCSASRRSSWPFKHSIVLLYSIQIEWKIELILSFLSPDWVLDVVDWWDLLPASRTWRPSGRVKLRKHRVSTGWLCHLRPIGWILVAVWRIPPRRGWPEGNVRRNPAAIVAGRCTALASDSEGTPVWPNNNIPLVLPTSYANEHKKIKHEEKSQLRH